MAWYYPDVIQSEISEILMKQLKQLCVPAKPKLRLKFS